MTSYRIGIISRCLGALVFGALCAIGILAFPPAVVVLLPAYCGAAVWAKILCCSHSSDIDGREYFFKKAASWYIRSAMQGRENACFEAGKVFCELFRLCKPIDIECHNEYDFTKSAHYLILARECYKREIERGSEDAVEALDALQGEDDFPIRSSNMRHKRLHLSVTAVAPDGGRVWRSL